MQKTAAIKVSMKELYPLIRETLDHGQIFCLPITGTSMLPTIKGGRDRVFLSSAVLPLKKGDLPLYRRDSGQFVLHRIVSVQQDGSYVCCGDNQWIKEPGIRPDQILAIAAELERKGRRFPVSNAFYRGWVRLWTVLLPVRFIPIKLNSCVRKLLRRFSKS